MDTSFLVTVSEEEIRRERRKAALLRSSPKRRKAALLRSSPWWKRKKAQGVCHYCGVHFPPKSLTMDHIVPIIRGGKSTKGNVVPACKRCNTKKKNQLLMEWELYRKGE